MSAFRLLFRKIVCSPSNRCHSGFNVGSVKYCTSVTVGDYDQMYKRSLNEKEEFWDEIAKNTVWHKPYDRVLAPGGLLTSPAWFQGGELNTCYNAVDKHVDNGCGDRLAIIHDSPVTGTQKKITYKELLCLVNKLGGILSDLGVTKGDHVLIYMPMIPEAVVAMLATTRLGAVHTVVFGGFAAQELSTRISNFKPKVIISASCGIEPKRVVLYKPLLDAAIEMSPHKPKKCVILQRPNFTPASMTKGMDIDWDETMAKSHGHDPVPVDSDHPCYVLYTSGTTGKPKGIVRPTGGHAVVLPWTMSAIYGMKNTDVWWSASDLGWIVGHSYICYAPLMNGNTTIIYEGKPAGTPDSNQFFRVVEEHKVSGMFTSPTAIRAIMQADINASISSNNCLRHLFIAGESLDKQTREWAEKAFKVPVLDNWWQTETGYAISAHCMGLKMDPNPPPGTTGKPFMGYDMELLTSDGSKAAIGELGRILCRLPLPPGTMTTLLGAHDRYLETYFTQFPGYYDTMDAGIVDKDGYLSILSRVDDVINVAGHRLSTLALEEALLEHPDVEDVAVCGVPDELKGVVPLGLVVVRRPREEAELAKELITIVRNRIGPVAAFRHSAIVSALPRTRSGKTPRGSIASLARGEKIKIPPTIEDPNVYSGIHAALQRCGFAKGIADPTIQKD